MEYTEKDLIMMYHTSLRNVGLYTSLSLALLGYSRYYRGKGSMVYNVAFIVFSILFMVSAITIGTYLIQDIELLLPANGDNEKRPYIIHKWLGLPKIIVCLLIIITCFALWTLIDQLKHGTK